MIDKIINSIFGTIIIGILLAFSVIQMLVGIVKFDKMTKLLLFNLLCLLVIILFLMHNL